MKQNINQLLKKERKIIKIIAEEKKANTALQDKNKQLVDALKPFADMFGELSESRIQQGGTLFKYNDKGFTVADLYAAYNALNPIK